eukprot:scaffold310720_cov36-Tisochrysis_lutea.AAC.1
MSLVKAVVGGGLAAAVYFYSPSALEGDVWSCLVISADRLKPLAIPLVGGLSLLSLLLLLVVFLLSSLYPSLISSNSFDVDAYVGQTPTVMQRAQVVLLHHLNVGSHKPVKEGPGLPLEDAPSPFVEGLRVTSVEGTRENTRSFAPGSAIVVGTIRMGFGHHRIAYAAASWALATNRTTYFHDLLNIDSPE